MFCSGALYHSGYKFLSTCTKLTLDELEERHELEEDESMSESLVHELSRSAGLGGESGSESLVHTSLGFEVLIEELESESLNSDVDKALLSVSLI